ncbi:hypothetical protein ACW2Q0_03785 [Nocardia sp. R16R-3T]
MAEKKTTVPDIEMHKMLIPDMAAPNYPHEYDFAPIIAENYYLLWDFFDTVYKSLGKGSKTDPPTNDNLPLLPNTVPHGQSRFFESYAVLVLRFNQKMTDLRDKDIVLAPIIQAAKTTIDDGKKAINATIDEVNDAAPKYPPKGISESDYIVSYTTKAFEDGETALDRVKTNMEQAAKDIKNPDDSKDDSGKTPSPDPKDLNTGNYDDNDPGNSNANDNAYTPPPIDAGTGTGSGTEAGTGTGTGDGTRDTASGINNADQKLQDAIDKLGNGSTGSGSTTTPNNPDNYSGSGMDSGMGSGLDSMLPMMMMQAMQRNQADPDLNDRRDEVDPNRYNQYPGAAVPVNASPTVAQPAAATTAAAAASTPPSNATSTQPAVAPGRTPDADGSVLYPFPNGKTQKVSAIVAQGLDAAFGNASGTDAQQAYEKTTAKWSDKKQIGTKIDPYQAMTGDVAIWDNRTAIVVIWPSEDGGTMDAIVNGQLVPLVSHMSDSAGDFGTFNGFAHPNGIELATGDKGAAPAVPGTGDPSAAAVPVVAAPA